MSKKKNVLSISDAFKVISFVLAAVLITSCAQRVVFPDSASLPGADAVLKINENKNNNYELELEVKNIAKPNRLTPPRNNYIVWLETASHGTVNIGNLRVSDKNRASMVTVTPYKPIRVFISAEDRQDVIFPSSQIVLNSEEFKVD